MFDDLPFGLATLLAIVMVWIGDHLAQYKVGGILGVNVTSRRCVQSGNKGTVEYHDNRKHRRHPSAM
jgi:hypothetical protein